MAAFQRNPRTRITWICGRDLERTRAAATSAGHGVAPHDAHGKAGHGKALRQGFLSDLANPKIAVFFTSFLPQFVHGDGPAFAALLLLGLVFALITFVWLAGYAIALGHASALMRRRSVRVALDRFTGVVLIAFGVRLAFEHR